MTDKGTEDRIDAARNQMVTDAVMCAKEHGSGVTLLALLFAAMHIIEHSDIPLDRAAGIMAKATATLQGRIDQTKG
jgi:hypothetical protein